MITRSAVIEFLESAWFGIKRQKVFINGVDQYKYKYLEIIELTLADEQMLAKLQGILGGSIKIIKRGKRNYYRLSMAGETAKKVCQEYADGLSNKKARAEVILKLSKDKLLRTRAPAQKQEYRESLFQKIKLL